jgi:hypothetical protein
MDQSLFEAVRMLEMVMLNFIFQALEFSQMWHGWFRQKNYGPLKDSNF